MRWNPLSPFQSRTTGRRTARASKFRPQFETLEDRWVPTTLPPGFQEFNVATGLSTPTAMALPPDYSSRVFIAQQGGAVRVYDAVTATLLPTPFLTVSTVTYFERGLQNITFDPDFVNNGYVYVYYTEFVNPSNANTFNRVERYTVDPNDPNRALPGSRQLIIRLDQVSAGNHNGGGLRFGYDGMLYITTGENAVSSNAQLLTNNLGKVLRIDPYRDDFPADPNRNFGVPADNPYPTGVRPEIYARGFRNPFHMATHPYYGWMFINDVGSSPPARREEINAMYFVPGDQNYGWPTREGIANDPRFFDPLFAYGSGYGGSNPNNCSIVGGDFYAYYDEPSGFPADYQDDYFFADYCGRWIHRYDPFTGVTTPFATGTAAQAIDVGMDYIIGAMYYLTRGTGASTGTLTLVLYTGVGPGGAPGGGSGLIVDEVLVDGLNSDTPTTPQVAPQTLAELPKTSGVDQVFLAKQSGEEAALVPVQRSTSDFFTDLWSPIF